MRRLACLLILTAAAAMAFPNPDGACTITTAAVLPQAVQGSSITYTFATSGCSLPIRNAELATGTLPPGLTLKTTSSATTLSGKPTSVGVYAFALRFFDATYKIPSKSFVIRVNEPLQIDTPAAATGTSGAPYTDTIRAHGGVAPYIYSVVQGSIPSGLVLSPVAGVISGPMPAAGSQFRIRVTDSSSVPNIAEKPFTIVAGGQITTVSLPPVGVISTPYSFDIDGSLGSSGFSVVIGSLPAGLSMAADGIISGTPTVVGSSFFTVRQTVGTASAWRSFRIIVRGPGTISGTPRQAEETFAYDHVFSAGGSVGPYTYSVSAGSLPTGITLDTGTGALLGELSQGASGTAFTINATDTTGASFSQGFSIESVLKLLGAAVTPPLARVNQAVNGVPVYSMSQGGAGKQFNRIGGHGASLIFVDGTTGNVTYGIPTAGNFTPVVLGTDSLGGAVVLNTATIGVVGPLAISTTSELPNSLTGAAYNASVVVVNGLFTPLTFAITSGSMPFGLSLNTSTGAITGTPDPMEGGIDYAFNISVTDAVGQTANRDFFIGAAMTTVITTNTIPFGTVGTPYSATLTQSGATGPVWTTTPANLPPGVTLSSGGVFSGTPTTVGTYTFDVDLSNAVNTEINTKRYTIRVSNPFSASISPVTTLNANVGIGTGASVTTAGGRAPFTMSIPGGALPEGLYFNNTASLAILGTPAITGSSSFNIVVTDADGRPFNIPYGTVIRRPANIINTTLAPGIQNVPYSHALGGEEGLAPYTFSSVGTLPTGVTLSSAGVLSGTPTVNGPFSFDVIMNDSAGSGGETSVTMTVTDAIAITNPAVLPFGLLLSPYSTPINTTGGEASKTFSITSGDLPPLVTINPSTGVISNLPLVPGTYLFDVRAEDISGRVATKSEQITIGGGITISPSTIPNGPINGPYSAQLNAVGAAGTVAWSIISGALPPGVTLGPSTGLISGTPTVAGPYSFTVQAVDQATATASAGYSMFVLGSLTVAPTTLPNVNAGGSYNQQLTASGSSGEVTWAVITGSLPAGLSLAPTTGIMSGTATTPGPANFTVQATDSVGQVGSRSYSITVLTTLTIAPASLPNATAGTAYNQTLTATNATGAVTWAVASGSLPAGLALAPTTGVISGTPTTPGTSPFTVQATDSLTQTGSQAYSITVLNVLGIAPPTLPNGTVGTAYNQALTATNASGAVTWAVTSGTLPAGLTLGASTGILSGTPTTPGNTSFTVTATDSLTQSGSRAYSITVLNVLGISPPALPSGTVDTPYTQTLTASGETGAVTWAVAAGSLPTGLTLGTSTGVIGGVPTTPGTYAFTVQATDSLSQTGTRSYSITISSILNITPATLPSGVVNSAYSQTLSVTNGTGAVSWQISSGTLPAGLSLGAGTGLISGTPTAAGTSTFSVQATDSLSQTGTRSYSVTIAGILTVAPTTVPDGAVGTSYSQTLTATGGSGALTWAINAGALPAGLTLGTSTGIINGTPLAAGTYTFTALATDSIGQNGARAYSMTIAEELTITPSTLPDGTIGTSYNQTLSVNGGTPGPAVSGTSWSISTGSLPPGLTLGASTGVISGTPTTVGTFPFTVVAAILNQTGSRAYTINISANASITPATLPDGLTGSLYSQALSVTGASGTFVFSVTTGSLPAGLTLASNGVLSGTPTAAGTSAFTVSAQNSQGVTAQRAYTLTIGLPLTITPATLPDGIVGVPYSQTLLVPGATSQFSFSVTAGSLPPGLTLATTGLLSGTPAAPGAYTFTVFAINSRQDTAQNSYTLLILDPFSITTATLPDGTETEPYTATLTSSNSTPTGVTWSMAAGTLPPGLTLAAATGVISGTTSVHGTYPFTVRATNSRLQQATKALSIRVVESLVITSQTLGDAVQGRPYTTVLAAAGGQAPYTWSLAGTSLPAGLTLNGTTGVISGTTNVGEGPFPQNVVVTDSRGRTARKTLPMNVTAPPPPSLSISPTTLPNGRVADPYSASFSATGGTPGYTFNVAQGALPSGLALSGGSLSGRPTQEGTFRFTVNVTDSAGRVAGNSYVVVIDPAPIPLVVTPASIAPTAPVGQPLSLQFVATGGKAPYTFALSGSAPPGMSFNSSGLLSGTPSQGGTFAFSIEATDSLQAKATRSYSLAVTGNLLITTPPLKDGIVGTAYSITFGVSGGRVPYTWNLTGTAPPGLTFDGVTGTLSGTPSQEGTYPFGVSVQDTQKLTATASFSITILAPLEITNTPADTPLVTGQPYTFTFSTRGGKAPVTFALSSGALPAGLSLSGGGTISGTPTAPGTFAFGVTATDALGNTSPSGATLRVFAPLTITTSSLPSGTVGTSYTSGLAATGGVPPLGAWSLSNGALPAGLSLAADGTISGTPTAGGTATFTVRIADGGGTEATRALSIAIALPPLPPISFTGLPQTLPPGTQSVITISLAQPFPVTVTGTLTLIFEPNAVNNADDPSVQFSSGGRTVTFTIPAGQTSGVFPVNPLLLITGTVAGTIRIQTTTNPASSAPVPESTVAIARSVPVITAGTAQVGTNSFTLVIDGFSNTREITSATFRLNPTPGAPLATTDVPVPVAAAFTSWYQSTAAAPFGGQFRMTLPFTVTGSVGDIESVIVTVSNAVGASQPFTVRLR